MKRLLTLPLALAASAGYLLACLVGAVADRWDRR